MNTSINIRLSEDLRDLIDSEAALEGVKSSTLARQILEDYFKETSDNDVYYSSLDEKNNKEDLIEEEIEDKSENILHSARFIQLLVWIYAQKSPYPNRMEKHTEQFQDTIIELNGCIHIPLELKKEFNKILAELIQSKMVYLYQFKFPTAFGKQRFNYSLLDEFIFNKKLKEIWKLKK